MIPGPICRIRHVGYDKICRCLIVYHPLKHHATPSNNVVGKIGRVQFSSDSNKICRMGKPIKWQVFVHVVMFMFLCVCPRADINVSTCQMCIWPHTSGELRNMSNLWDCTGTIHVFIIQRAKTTRTRIRVYSNWTRGVNLTTVYTTCWLWDTSYVNQSDNSHRAHRVIISVQ